jgi:hypothetical protein
MGARQREISVSEFLTKNRHPLGFDSPRKALLTCVKEAVDNALDAAEEAGILPDVVVRVGPRRPGARPASVAADPPRMARDDGLHGDDPPVGSARRHGPPMRQRRPAGGQTATRVPRGAGG